MAENDPSVPPSSGATSAGPVRTVAITSGKGGVGKTNVSVNLAVALAALGRKVMLMDADLGLANVDVLLGLKAQRNLSHVLEGECSLEDAIVLGPGGIHVVLASSGVQRMAQLSQPEHAGIIHAFSELSLGLDTLLVDTGAGIADNVMVFCRAAQDVVVVVCDEPASITDAYALIKVLHSEQGIGTVHVIANMVTDREHGLRLFSTLAGVVDRFLDVDLRFLGAVPFDNYLRRAVREQRAVVDAYPLSKAALSMRSLAVGVDAWPQPRWASGHLQFFVERLLGATSPGSHGLV
jgi:flagellar biosynthesis protein FlhG